MDHREPDALPGRLPAVAVVPIVGAALAAIVRSLHARVEHLAGADALAKDLAGGQYRPFPDKVLPSQRHGVDAKRGGDLLHVQLGGKQRLRRAETPKRAVGRRVGGHGPRAHAHVAARVRSGGVQRAAREHDGRQRHVGTAVHDDVDVLRHQRAVAPHAGSVTDPRRVPLGRRQHVFVAVVDDLDGTPCFPRQQRRVAGDDIRILFLAAKPAPGRCLDHPDAVVGESEEPFQRLVHVVRALHRAGHHERAVGLDPGSDGVVLDVGVLLMREVVLAFDHQVGSRQAAIDVAALDPDVLEHVVVAVEPGGRRQRVINRQHRRLGTIDDGDVPERLVRLVAIAMRDKRDRLHLVHDARIGEQRLVVGNQRDAVVGDITGGHDDEVGPGKGRVECHRANRAVGNRRPQGDAGETTGDGDVVQVLRAAGDLLRPFAPRHTTPNRRHGPCYSRVDPGAAIRAGHRDIAQGFAACQA